MKEIKEIKEIYETLLKDESDLDLVYNYIWNIEYLKTLE